MSERRINQNDLARWENTGATKYDYAIAGLPFFSAAEQQFPYTRQTSAFRKDQVDSAPTPGEQSLGGWWYRSQNSFDLGAGALYNDTLRNDPAVRRFFASTNVDVFTEPGKVKLLPKVVIPFAWSNQSVYVGSTPEAEPIYHDWQYRRIIAANPIAIPDITGDPTEQFAAYLVRRDTVRSTGQILDRVFAGFGGDVLSVNPPEIVWKDLPTDGTDQIIYDIVGIGDNIIISSNTGVYFPSASMSNTWIRRYSSPMDKLAIVKERLIMASGPLLFAVDPTPTDDASSIELSENDAFYKHADSTWRWTTISEGPSRLYFGGAPIAGAKISDGNPQDLTHAAFSTIYASGLEQQDSKQLPTIYTPVEVAQLPIGEYLTTMISYMGTYMVLGTTAGVRVSFMDGNGGLVVGPLSVKSVTDVTHLAAHGNFVYAACQPRYRLTGDQQFTMWQNASATLVRLDLSKQIDVGGNLPTFAWSEDQSFPSGYDGALSTGLAYGPTIFDFVILPDGKRDIGQDSADGIYFSANAFRGPRLAVVYQINADENTFETAYPELAYAKGGIFITDNKGSRTTGGLQTGRIRFDTDEKKIFQYLRVGTEHALGTINNGYYSFDALKVDWTDSDGGGGELAILDEPGTNYNWGDGPTTYELDGSDASPHKWVSYRFTLTGPGGGLTPNSEGRPHFMGYQAKAQPANVRQRIITLPLMMAQRESGPHGRIIERSVQERLLALETAEETNAVVLFQDLHTGETRPCIIEEIRYISDFIPESPQAKNAKPGLLYITVRTVNSRALDAAGGPSNTRTGDYPHVTL